MKINGYTTTKEELQWMADNWTLKDIENLRHTKDTDSKSNGTHKEEIPTTVEGVLFGVMGRGVIGGLYELLRFICRCRIHPPGHGEGRS